MSHETSAVKEAPAHDAGAGSFADEVRAIPGGEHLELCYSCGTCVSQCMIQQKVEPEYNPRRLLRMVMMGMREQAFSSLSDAILNTIEMAFRAYDPCLGCATHAMPGETPLLVRVYNHEHELVQEIRRD